MSPLQLHYSPYLGPAAAAGLSGLLRVTPEWLSLAATEERDWDTPEPLAATEEVRGALELGEEEVLAPAPVRFITLETVFLAALAPDPDPEAASCCFALNCAVCFTGTLLAWLLAEVVLVVLVMAVRAALALAPAVQ